MVNYSNIFPLSTGSGNNQIIVVNTNTTLNNGGFYQTGNLTADIEIDISNVPVNDEIAFYNTSTKNVVISGISTVDNISIPTNKGVRISSNNGGGFIKNISDNINNRLGSYTVDWIPGQKPPVITLTPTTPQDTNGLIYYIGTDGLTASYSNPVGSTVSFAYVGSGLNGSIQQLFDRSSSGQYIYWQSASPKPSFTLTLPAPFKITHLAYNSPSNTTTYNKVMLVKAWNTGGSISSPTFTSSNIDFGSMSSNQWKLMNCVAGDYYTFYAVELVSSDNNDNYFRASEFEFYGLYTP